VLSNEELQSRYNTYTEAYETLIAIEAGAAADIAKTLIIPAAVSAISEYSAVAAVKGLADEMSALLEKVVAGVAKLDAAEGAKNQLAAMLEVREAADALEAIVPADLWPMPSYAEMILM
jgi:glutamine synthetase